MTPDEIRATNEQLQAAYQQTFNTPIGRRVLIDLVAYYHDHRTTFDPDERTHAFREGQRDVLLRIQEFTNLSIEEIYQLRGTGHAIAHKEDTDV